MTARSQPVSVLHPDGHLSESTPILGPTLMAILGEPLERWRLAHNDCSELAYIGLHSDGHPSEQQPILGLILTVILRESPERWRLVHNDYSESAYIGVFTLTVILVS